MGGSQSCFPSPLDKINTLRRHRHASAKSQRYQINKNNNAINIDRASEDELLKLPGVTRPLAQEILYHRQSKDGSKHVDELLQLSGMQPNVSVPSPPPSRLDANQRSEPIHLNYATYEQLLTVPGLTPILAERVVQRRERKGPFRFVEDLLKVKGIDYIVLARLRTYVTVDDRPIRTSVSLTLESESIVSQFASTHAECNRRFALDGLAPVRNVTTGITNDSSALSTTTSFHLFQRSNEIRTFCLVESAAIDHWKSAKSRCERSDLSDYLRTSVRSTRIEGEQPILTQTIHLDFHWSVFRRSGIRKRSDTSFKNWINRPFPRSKIGRIVSRANGLTRSVTSLVECFR